jgi:hypothetical protein
MYVYWRFDTSITLFSWLIFLSKALKKKDKWRLEATKVHEDQHAADMKTPIRVLGWFKFMLRWLFDPLWKAWYECRAYAASYPIWIENGHEHDYLVYRAAWKITHNKYPKFLRWICPPPPYAVVDALIVAYGGIELAKTAIKKRNGRNDERRSASFQSADRLMMQQTHAKTEEIEDDVGELASTLKDMGRTLDDTLGETKTQTRAIQDLVVELRARDGR